MATTPAGQRQRAAALVATIGFVATTLLLLPSARAPMPPIPGFVATYQIALVIVYGLSSYLLFTQFSRSRAVPILLLAAGSLYITIIVFAQLLSFPNILAPGRLLGSGPDTTVWLWTLWHFGPPLYALAYALAESAPRRIEARHLKLVTWGAAASVVVASAIALLAITRYVHLLPKSVEGDDYTLLTMTGIGPAAVGMTIVALVTLWRVTRGRTVLQLWLAVSLIVLVCDNVITLIGASRGTIGWFVGRIEALIAGMIVLAVYLRELDFLYGRAEQTAVERERARLELQKVKDDLTLALDAANLGDWDLELASDIATRSARHERIFGYDDFSGDRGKARLLRHVLPEDRPVVEQAFASALAHGRLQFECRIERASDKAVRWISMLGKTIYDLEGRPVRMAGVVSDVTERHEAEQRLREAERMEAVGQLTGGVAHDFNNLLMVITGSLEMIRRRPGDDARVARLSQAALDAAVRGAQLTNQLLTFARRRTVRPETANANQLIQRFAPLMRRAVGDAISLKLNLDPALYPVRVDPGEFETAILNIAVNARDAMPNGGTVTIASQNIVAAAADVSATPEIREGEYALVTVSDTGPGMAPEVAARAFEPFFTTKGVGKGTGLGLSQVYGFAKQAGGHARIGRAPEGGARIDLLLPRSADESRSLTQPPESETMLRKAHAGEVVLVVEDDPAVLAVAVESLQELGYRVLTAEGASEALELIRGDDRVDILFSDVVMPGGMNGVQLAVEAQRLRPGLRIVLASGYSAGVAGEGHAVPYDVPVLAKPYRREDLASKLRLVLGA